MLPELKAAQRPALRRLVERRQELEEALIQRDDQVKERGYSLQVSPQRGASPLFLLRHGERRRIEWRDGGYSLRGKDEARGDDRGAAGDHRREPGRGLPRRPRPARRAGRGARHHPPGAWTRRAFVHGPGCRHPRRAGGDAPWVALRPQTLILEASRWSGWRRWASPSRRCWAITPASTAGWRSAMAATSRVRCGAGWRRRWPSCAPPPWRPIPTSSGRSTRPATRSSTPSTSSARRRPRRRRARTRWFDRRTHQLREACLPLGRPQERTLSTAHFPGKYGPEFAESLWTQMELDSAHLQVIVP